jgi:glyoxylase-like metal-dependent hydrolase (beta-lactamase superfamily II)
VQVQKLRDGLWRWTGLHPDWTPDDGGPEGWEQEVASVYYEASDAVVLIDPLVPPEDEERFWAALDRDVERAGTPVHVLLTVFWHARSSQAIADRYGAEIWAHEKALQAPERPVEPTRTFRFGEALPGGVGPMDAVEFEEAILWISSHGALVSGDVILGSPLRLCPESWLGQSSHAALKDGLRPLLDLPVELVLPSHGAPVLQDGRAALAAILESA